MKVLVEIDLPERSMLTGAAIASALRQAVAKDFRDVDLTDKRVGANEGKLMSSNGHSIGTWSVREPSDPECPHCGDKLAMCTACEVQAASTCTECGRPIEPLMDSGGHFAIGTCSQCGTGQGAAALASAEIRHGFLTRAEVEAIAADRATRLKPMLVRCGGGRFICAAQDVAHYIEIIERDAAAHVDDGLADYIRDISLPVGPHYVVPSSRSEFAYAGIRATDRFRVTAIFTSDADANRHLATHPDEGAIATLGQFVIVAEHQAAQTGDPARALRAAWDLLQNTEVRYFIRDGEGDHLGEAAQYDNALKLARAAGLK